MRVYEPNPVLTPVWICDLDGTLAHFQDDVGARGPFDWHRVMEDHYDRTIGRLISGLWRNGDGILFVSGRDEVCREDTEKWLAIHLPSGLAREPIRGYTLSGALLMRPKGSFEKDVDVKARLFWEQVAPRFAVVGVIEDRQQVVDMWRAMGLVCLQVAAGDF